MAVYNPHFGFFQQQPPQQHSGPVDPVVELKMLFDRIDLEKNGSLNFNEFFYFIQLNNPSVSQQQAEAIFWRIDRNRSGKIVWTEFLEATRDPQLRLVEVLTNRPSSSQRGISPVPQPVSQPAQGASGQSGHRRLTAKEMQAALALFEKLDADGNDQVTISEFKQAIKSADPTYPDADIQRLFFLIDSDGTGTISVDEFLRGISAGQLNPTIFSKLVTETRGFEWEIQPTELKTSTKLGEGSFGEVFAGTWRGAKVAIKILKDIQRDLRVQKDFQDEVTLLSKIRHPNCVLFLGANMNPPNFLMVTEFCGKGTLTGILEKKGLTKETYLQVILGIAIGLNYLHLRQPKIIHRDLKPDNVLLDDNMTPKLADFGLSTIRTASSKAQEMCGTPAYMAPEIWKNQPYDEKVDVYAYGIVVFECTFYQSPFACKTIEEYARTSASNVRPQLPKELHPTISSVMSRSWDPNPNVRPSINDTIVELGKLMRK